MNYTQNVQLPQWVETDRIMMADFNEAMAKVDQGMGAIPRMVSGSYVGTGAYGSESPNHLEFGFAPKVVILVANKTSALKCGTVLVAGQSSSSGIGTSYSSNSSLGLILTWGENGLSWYTGNAERQLNEEGTTYFYFALG